jgi:hypothetical protein
MVDDRGRLLRLKFGGHLQPVALVAGIGDQTSEGKGARADNGLFRLIAEASLR